MATYHNFLELVLIRLLLYKRTFSYGGTFLFSIKLEDESFVSFD